MPDTPRNDWIGLRLDPLDTLFFRDGKPFEAANRVVGGFPNPQTLAGAIRTALLARTGFSFLDFAAKRQGKAIKDALEVCNADKGVVNARFRGPFLGLADERSRIVEPLLAMPAILSRAKKPSDGWSLAWPIDTFSGWEDKDGLLPLSCGKKDPTTKPVQELLTLKGIKSFLDVGANHNDFAPDDKQVIRLDRLRDFDNRIGIELNAHTLTSEEGQLYMISLLALQPEQVSGRRVCLYAEIQPGNNGRHDYANLLDNSAVPFGGEGKYVRVTVQKSSAEWPKVDPGKPSSLWYLASPTFLTSRNTPNRPLPQTEKLKAAASGPGLAISGWDIAKNGPRATRFAVPAGAVYFLDEAGTDNLFLNQKSHDDSDLQLEGWGFALQGNWR